MRVFIILALTLSLLVACGPDRVHDKVGFSPEQIRWLKEHDCYNQVMAVSFDKQKRIQEIIQSELDLAGELQNLADSLQILYPEFTIEFEP